MILLDANEINATPYLIMALSPIAAIFIYFALVINSYKKPKNGFVLVRTGFGGIRVSFTGIFAVPVLQRVDEMDVREKVLHVERKDDEALIFKDDIVADINIDFYVRVKNTVFDIIEVAQKVGCADAGKEEIIRNLFCGKLIESMQDVASQFDYYEVKKEPHLFRDSLLTVFNKLELNGYLVEDIAIAKLKKHEINTEIDN